MNKIDDKEKKDKKEQSQNMIIKNTIESKETGNRKSTRTETEEHQLKTKRISSKKRWRRTPKTARETKNKNNKNSKEINWLTSMYYVS